MTKFKEYHQLLKLVSDYANAAVQLYGAIRVEDFTTFFHHYETEQSVEQMESMLSDYHEKIGKLFPPIYHLYEDFIVHEQLLEDIEIYGEEALETMRAYTDSAEEMGERYLPPKEEVLNHSSRQYFYPEEPFEKLREFLFTHVIVENEQEESQKMMVEEILYALNVLAKVGMPKEHLHETFEQDLDIDFRQLSKQERQTLKDIAEEIHDGVRLFYYAGFTREEAGETEQLEDLDENVAFLMENPKLVIQIAHYAEAAASLYGGMHFKDFTTFYNRYEAPLSQEMIMEALAMFLAVMEEEAEKINYRFFRTGICHVLFEDEEDMGMVLGEMASSGARLGKRYYPPKKDVLKYRDILYFHPAEGFAKLGAFLTEHGIVKDTFLESDKSLKYVDGLLSQFYFFVQLGFPPDQYRPCLEKDFGLDFRKLSNKQLFELDELFLEIFSGARKFDVAGFTMEELSMEEGFTSSADPVRVEKVGRNDPCPCGSGKKFKKCCG